MARTKRRKPGMLKGLKFDEVSLVAAGANQNAHVSILKMEEAPETVLKASFNDILAERLKTDEEKQLIRDLEKVSYVFADSVWPLMTDSSITDKSAAINENLNQFAQVMMSMVNDHNVIKELENLIKAETKSYGGVGYPASDFAYVPDPEKPSTWKLRLTKEPGGKPDSGIVGAAIAALGKGFRGQKVQIPSSKLSSVKAKVRQAWKKANPDKNPDDMPGAIKKENIPVKETIEYFQTLAKMNDAEKAAFVGLADDAQEAIIKTESMDKRIEMVRKHVKVQVTEEKKIDKSKDESIVSGGVTIYKSEVGDGAFAFMKGQQVALEKERDLRITKEFEDEAENLFPNYPGDKVAKGKMLRSLRELPKDQQEVQLKMLKAGDAAISQALKTNGSDDSAGGNSGIDKLDTLAKEHQKANPGMTFEKAYSEVMRTDEGGEAYDESLGD